ncbi:hypothetical protein [Pseudoclavibacter sp. CFCC 11306]|uniref:hypothetical protein n=1 Tax=Pseudoclavibacter sp. CFCC 11306 TaxID=1564493 RepID=UPI001300E755|nr:hypothetical protein [Pseudoclavibacter sp. CFCC 11306]KAB1658174.1 hypothetical protein F8O09_00625 [Pseudoclavibacter sp. CFCC 11306]
MNTTNHNLTCTQTLNKPPGHHPGETDTSRRHRREICQRLIAKYGEPFEAFLTLDNLPTDPDELEPCFIDSYQGTYESEQAIADQILTALGWKQAITHVLSEQAIPEQALNWNYPIILRYIRDGYDVIHRGNTTYLFAK